MRMRIAFVLMCGVAAGFWACDTPEYLPDGAPPNVDASLPDVSSCNAPNTTCGTACTNLADDPTNCGKCGNACSSGSACVSGTCTSMQTLCQPDGGAPYYANLATDNANCGACGAACAGPASVCTSGHCCGAGNQYCGGACSDPQTDNANCGMCGNACSTATGSCVLGSCFAYPKSCSDLLARLGDVPDGGPVPDSGLAMVPVPDGNYWIDPDGTGPLKPFVVYCSGMGTLVPRDYLPFVHSYLSGEPASNTVTIGAGGACSCGSNAVYEYSHVHINVSNPAKLIIDIADHSFAYLHDPTVSTCWNGQGGACGGAFQNPDYGGAFSCTCAGITGAANVDLRGTGFTIDPSTSWVLGGSNPGGSAILGDAGDTLNATGGGCCGTEIPTVGTGTSAVQEIVIDQH
jgi:hypothetical protein